MAILAIDDYSHAMAMETDEIEDRPDTWQAMEPGLIIPGLRLLGRERARIWALVLDARGVPCCLEQPLPSQWELHVPLEYLGRAMEEISNYEEKNLGWPPALPPPRPMVENTL